MSKELKYVLVKDFEVLAKEIDELVRMIKMFGRNNVSADLREQLSKRIRSMSDSERVDFQEYLKKHALNGVTGGYGVEGKVWTPNLTGPLSGLVIGGYGDTNVPYGAGPTRPVDHATYAVRVTDAQENVPLSQGILHKPAEGLNAIMYLLEKHFTEEELKQIYQRLQENQKYRRDVPENPFTVASKKGVEFNGVPTFLEVELANVDKSRFDRQGDIAIYLVRQLGSGLNYMGRKDYDNLKDSTATYDILSRKTPIAEPLRHAVVRNVQDLGGVADNFFRQLPEGKRKRIVMLTVDNV